MCDEYATASRKGTFLKNVLSVLDMVSEVASALVILFTTVLLKDIGIAEPMLCVEMLQLYDEWLKIYKSDPPRAQLISMRVVWAMAQGHKNLQIYPVLMR